MGGITDGFYISVKERRMGFIVVGSTGSELVSADDSSEGSIRILCTPSGLRTAWCIAEGVRFERWSMVNVECSV